MLDRIKSYFISKRELQERITKLEGAVLPPKDVDWYIGLLASIWDPGCNSTRKRTLHGGLKPQSLTLAEMRELLIAVTKHLGLSVTHQAESTVTTVETPAKKSK